MSLIPFRRRANRSTPVEGAHGRGIEALDVSASYGSTRVLD